VAPRVAATVLQPGRTMLSGSKSSPKQSTRLHEGGEDEEMSREHAFGSQARLQRAKPPGEGEKTQKKARRRRTTGSCALVLEERKASLNRCSGRPAGDADRGHGECDAVSRAAHLRCAAAASTAALVALLDIRRPDIVLSLFRLVLHHYSFTWL
jgi:hypothetical protein